jgi:hypothetical protein
MANRKNITPFSKSNPETSACRQLYPKEAQMFTRLDLLIGNTHCRTKYQSVHYLLSGHSLSTGRVKRTADQT